MSRLTKDAVFTAIEELTKNGTEATVIALHKHLGKGSFSTISKYFNEYREQYAEEVEQAELAAIPTVESLGIPSNIHKKAVEAAESQLATLYANIEQTFLSAKKKIQEESDDRVSLVRAELAKKIEDYDSVVTVSDEQESQIEAMETEREANVIALTKIENESSSKTKKISQLEFQITELNKTNEKLEKKINEMQGALADSKTLCGVTQGLLDRSNLSIAELKRDIEEASIRERALITENCSLESQVKSKQLELYAVISARDSFSAENNKLVKRLQEAEAKLIETTTKNEMYKEQQVTASKQAKKTTNKA